MLKTSNWLPQNGYAFINNGVVFEAYSANPGLKPAEGMPDGDTYGTYIHFGATEYSVLIFIDVFGNLWCYGTNDNTWTKIGGRS